MRWRRSERVGQRALPFRPSLWRRWRRWRRQQWQDAAYVLVATLGWMTGNLLTVLGCVVAAFLVISDGDFAMFMAQIDNVASRYVAADLGRRATFEHEVILALAIAAGLFFALRLPRFVMRLRLELQQGNRHADSHA